jgi:hypothetical protein
MFRVLGLITYLDEIPITQVGYKNLKIQYPAYKGLVGYCNDMYEESYIIYWFFKNQNTILIMGGHIRSWFKNGHSKCLPNI